jgi:hypothetical protein
VIKSVVYTQGKRSVIVQREAQNSSPAGEGRVRRIKIKHLLITLVFKVDTHFPYLNSPHPSPLHQERGQKPRF